MKLYNKTLVDILHQHDLSRTSATTACIAAAFHKTDKRAK